jgi:carbonic anhydrase
MSIQEILQANNKFLSKYRKIKIPSANGWAIVTCCDRRLSGLLEAAMGFRPGEAHVVRNAGNTITPFDNSIIRGLSLLVLKEGMKNIAVIGHTGCQSSTGSAELAKAMEAAGIKREMAGSDLREFYGLTADAASNVRSTVDKIIGSGLLPVGINVYGLLLETTTGRLKSICGSTIEPINIPRAFDSSAYRSGADPGAQTVTQMKKVRSQERVRQFTGRIETPKEVHSPVKSVKVPVNIRTPVREVKVPTKITVHKNTIEMPGNVQMPPPAQQYTGHKEAPKPVRSPEKRRRNLDSLRGQSLGSWDPGRKPARPESSQKKGNKFCPRCGAEYYGHVKNCADCRVKLVSAKELKRNGNRRIKPVLGSRGTSRPRQDDRRRGYDKYSRRR